MAGETILVVDDSAVNLKLAAAVLRSEGYRVLLAASAEQALMTLRTTVPDLALVDVQLPGMNGLELTRAIREDFRTRQLLVVVLTASTELECEQQAYEAGCDGFISKPIDTRTLGTRLRSFLGAPGVPETPVSQPVAPADTGLSLAGPEMDSLRRSFLVDGHRQVRRMLEFVGSQIDPVAARKQFHQWIGAAGALGYMELAEKARAAEKLLGQPSWSMNDLRDSLTNLAHAFAAPSEAAETEIPAFLCRQLARQRIALVGFADVQAERVCIAFEKVVALPLLFSGNESPDADSVKNCSVVMVHVREQTRNLPWLLPQCNLRQPLVLIGGREDLLSLPPGVQAAASDFLIDSWQPEEVVIRLSLVLARGTAGTDPAAAGDSKPDVLLVDDDPNVIAVVRTVLESQGIKCRHALNGGEALAKVNERPPHALVLDVNMPGMDGFAVLAAIRELGLDAKVILLTARQHERDILRGFELGADDYVVKPFHPLELAARLKRLV